MNENQFDDDFLLEEKEDTKLQKPAMYRILLHNDHYTTQEFVVFVLQEVFGKDIEEAVFIMLEAHMKGIAAVGIYTYEVAKSNLDRAEEFSEEFGYPLLYTMEEVDL